MLGRTYSGQACSTARALEVVGERWTLLIVRNALQGTTRFDDFLEALGVSRNVLSVRLNGLVENGVLERVQYQERPDRFEYVMTPMGRALAPVIGSLMEWGDVWLPRKEGPARVIEHAGCGGHVHSRMVCDACGDEVTGANITLSYSRAPATEAV